MSKYLIHKIIYIYNIDSAQGADLNLVLRMKHGLRVKFTKRCSSYEINGHVFTKHMKI